MARNKKGCGCGMIILLLVTAYIAVLYVKKMKEEKPVEHVSPASQNADH